MTTDMPLHSLGTGFLTHNNQSQLLVVLSHDTSVVSYYDYDPKAVKTVSSTFKVGSSIPVNTVGSLGSNVTKSSSLALSLTALSSCLSHDYSKMGYLNDVAAGGILCHLNNGTLHVLAISVLQAYRGYGLAQTDAKIQSILAYVPVTQASSQSSRDYPFLQKAGFELRVAQDKVEIVEQLPLSTSSEAVKNSKGDVVVFQIWEKKITRN